MRNRILCWVTWLLCASSGAHADVTMFEPMSPHRADRVTANWEDDELADLAMDITVMGKNESTQDVGYFEEEWFIDPADWAEAVNAYAALPDPGNVLVRLRQAGLVYEEGEPLYLPWWDFDGDVEATEGQLITANMQWNQFRLANPGSWEHFITDVVIYDNGSGSCWAKFRTYDSRDGVPPYNHSPPTWTSGTNIREWSLTQSEDCDTWTEPELVDASITADGEDLAVFLPIAVGSEAKPSIFPGSVVPFTQNERSAIALLTAGAQNAADSATAYYESDAYQGYPAFVLYYGFFAGDPDAPEDEGDCEGSFCDGGGGGGGGGTGDLSELVDLLSGGMVDADPFEVPDGQSIADQVMDGLGELPCLGCEFIDEGNGWENTEVAEEASGLADDFFGIFPAGGSCSLITVDLIPSKDVAFSIDTCDLSVVKLILELLCGGGTLMACIYIVVPKKTSGGSK